MDWDDNGFTTISGVMQSADLGRRPTVVDGRECQEYFRLKDGMIEHRRCTVQGRP